MKLYYESCISSSSPFDHSTNLTKNALTDRLNQRLIKLKELVIFAEKTIKIFCTLSFLLPSLPLAHKTDTINYTYTTQITVRIYISCKCANHLCDSRDSLKRQCEIIHVNSVQLLDVHLIPASRII